MTKIKRIMVVAAVLLLNQKISNTLNKKANSNKRMKQPRQGT